MKLIRCEILFNTNGTKCSSCGQEDSGLQGIFFIGNGKIGIQWPPENKCPKCGNEELYNLSKIKELLEKNLKKDYPHEITFI